MSGLVLESARIINSDLSNAILSEIKLVNTDLRNSVFINANMRLVVFSVLIYQVQI